MLFKFNTSKHKNNKTIESFNKVFEKLLTFNLLKLKNNCKICKTMLDSNASIFTII